MSGFRSFQTAARQPASPMEPVVDPAGWTPGDFGDVADWSYRLTENDCAEICNAVAAFRKTERPIVAVGKDDFVLTDLAETLADVRRELLDGRGMVMLQNFPIERLDREGVAIGYLGLGSHLGERMVQNGAGHVLGHVKDTGGNYETGRGYNTNAELRFHADACDYVGLLCLKTAKSGGESRVASSVTVYNRMLKERPDLIAVLSRDFYRSHNGEMSPGEDPWFKQPIFSFTDGYFSATGAGSTIEKALRLPGVPPLSAEQKEAIQVYRDTVAECALDIPFVPGDIQYLNNYVTLHSRRGYEDWSGADDKRHLLRQWLRDVNGRPIPKAQREGRSGRGVRVAGMKLIAPLDAEMAA